MKIIAIKGNYNISKVVSDSCVSVSDAHVIADSALTKSGKPVFLPSIAGKWLLNVTLVLSIGRLGKHISSRFASRYIDGIAAGFSLTATEPDNGELVRSMDGAAMVGNFVPFTDTAQLADARISVAVNGEPSRPVFSSANLVIPPLELISQLSRYVTLKMGDLIFTSQSCCDIHPVIGDNITAKLNETDNLKIRFR